MSLLNKYFYKHHLHKNKTVFDIAFNLKYLFIPFFLCQDCYKVYQSLGKMPHLIEALEKTGTEHKNLLMQLYSNPIKVNIKSFFFVITQ